jgi:hypothetical protein
MGSATYRAPRLWAWRALCRVVSCSLLLVAVSLLCSVRLSVCVFVAASSPLRFMALRTGSGPPSAAGRAARHALRRRVRVRRLAHSSVACQRARHTTTNDRTQPGQLYDCRHHEWLLRNAPTSSGKEQALSIWRDRAEARAAAAGPLTKWALIGSHTLRAAGGNLVRARRACGCGN